MDREATTRKGLLSLSAFVLAVLVVAGCNATGLKEPPQPTPVATPTTVFVLPPATTTRQIESTQTPYAAATATLPRPATETAETGTTGPATTETPEETPTSLPAATEEAGTVSPTPALLPQAERVRIFEQVWSTVQKNYLYPDFHGANWQALHDKTLPLVTNAANSEAYYKAISDMIDQLKDDHSRYLSPQEAREEDDLQNGNANYVGIGILSSPDKNAVGIVFVFPGSPAEKAGLQRRDKIVAIDGTPITDPLKDPARIRGPIGSTVTLSVHSPGRPPRDVSIVRDTITGGIVPTGSRLQGDAGVGYLVIPDLWTDNMADLVHSELQKQLASTTPLRAIIIDLRGNGGGFRTTLENILGDFVSGQVGVFFNQKEQTPFEITKSDLYYKLKNVPLAVLVDQGTESYAEVLAATLQATGRAKVVGATTAGNTETIYRYDFEDTSRLWVAEESFKLMDGTNLEGRGVIPDVTVSQDWTTFTERNDPDILQAIKLLTK